MPKYNPVSKTEYEYAYQVEMDNTFGEAPKIIFRTQTVSIDGPTGVETVEDYKRSLTEPYVTNETFDLLDADGNVVGQTDYDSLYQMMYSLFFHVAQKRDN